MKIAFDAGVLGLVMFPQGGIPNDFRTGKPIERATERVQALIDESEAEKDEIVIPTPSLAEALVPIADSGTIDTVVAAMESQSCFRIVAFDKKAAIELALRTKKAVDAGDKKEGAESQWQKVKYDRQIIAIAQAQGATLYSMDKDVHHHAKLWGLPVLHVADIPVPVPVGVQKELFESKEAITEEQPEQASSPSESSVASREETNAGPTKEQPTAIPASPEVRRSDNGSSEDQADAQAAKEAKAGDGTGEAEG